MLIKNAKILEDSVEKIVDIYIKNGKIENIAPNLEINIIELNKEKADKIKILDANNSYVIPGVIDLHTHMRDPGLTHKETSVTGSKAAARGGVTSFIDMPNTIPNTITFDVLQEKRKIYNGSSYVDYGFNFGGSKDDNSSEILKANKFIASTKIFLNESTGHMLVLDEGVIYNIFKASKIVSVHAETEMVKLAIELSEKTDTPLYLCHISLKSELDYIKEAKKMGLKVFAEVTPHHLFLNTNDLNANETNKILLRMKPELKSKEDNNALWNAINEGIIDTIGTDHAPHLISEKKEKVTFGIPSIEHSLELMLRGVKDKKITLSKLIEIMCHNPAKIFNLKNKGFLKEGYDGDLVILDMNDESEITSHDVISKCGWTAYESFKRGGKVKTTILRGNIVYSDGKFYPNLGKELQYNE